MVVEPVPNRLEVELDDAEDKEEDTYSSKRDYFVKIAWIS
jgi:hypothetical protein